MIPSSSNVPDTYVNNVINATWVAENKYINQFGFRVNTF